MDAGSAAGLETVLVMEEIIPEFASIDLFLSPHEASIWSHQG